MTVRPDAIGGSGDGRKKVAALLLAMGEPTAERVVRRLDDRLLRQITDAADELPAMSRELIEALVEDFAGAIARHSGIHDPGARLSMMLQHLHAQDGSPEEHPERPADPGPRPDEGGLLAALSKHPPSAIAPLLANHADGVIVVALSVFPADLAGHCLGELPADRRGRITHRLIGLEQPHSLVRRAVLTTLCDALNAPDPDEERRARRSRVAGILNMLDRDAVQDIMGVISQSDPREAARLGDLLFDFSDLPKLDESARVLIFDGADAQRIADALGGADAQLRETVLSALGARARRMVEAELQSGNVSPDAARRSARQDFVARALKLAEEGRISLKSPDEAVNANG